MKMTRLRVLDIRFPTSMQLDGSDAMNPDPDYSAAYCILETDQTGLPGPGLTFTIGRGIDIRFATIASLAPLVHRTALAWLAADGDHHAPSCTGDRLFAP